MRPQNTDDYLRDLLAARLGLQPAVLGPEAALKGLGADSLDLVSLIMEIEDELDIDIPDEEAAQLSTVKQLMDYIALAVATQETLKVRQIPKPYKKAVGYR
jgi:acyl carrier protein